MNSYALEAEEFNITMMVKNVQYMVIVKHMAMLIIKKLNQSLQTNLDMVYNR